MVHSKNIVFKTPCLSYSDNAYWTRAVRERWTATFFEEILNSKWSNSKIKLIWELDFKIFNSEDCSFERGVLTKKGIQICHQFVHNSNHPRKLGICAGKFSMTSIVYFHGKFPWLPNCYAKLSDMILFNGINGKIPINFRRKKYGFEGILEYFHCCKTP
jgi:hypothetical protein